MLKIEYVDINSIKEYKNNAKEHPREQIEQIKKSIKEFGNNDPIGVWHNEIVEGHGRYTALKELGEKEIPIIRLDNLTDEQRKAYTLVHNKLTMNSDFDIELLSEELSSIDTIDMSEFGFDLGLGEEETSEEKEKGSLQEEFIVPPFSVFDSKQGYWQDRKRLWLKLGIKSENGRNDSLISDGLLKLGQMNGGSLTGTSIFDPVLCEICYKWFNIEKGKIYDPFAGGSVRGIIASKLGYDYTGIDLRQEQIDANKQNAKELGVNPTWYCDDSNNVDKYIEDNSVDMIFSCPPYADLEVYSDDPRDLSNMEYEDFCKVYGEIIEKACRKLKDNRFAVFVVGDIKDKNGNYRNFIDLTKKCFNDNGCNTYNGIIYLQNISTASVRARRPFNSGRKVTKIHQNVLVFYKGDTKKIKDNYKELDFEYINDLLNSESDDELL